MTTNAHKSAARRYQREHPGTPLPVALRATAKATVPAPDPAVRPVGPGSFQEFVDQVARQGRGRPVVMCSDLLAHARASQWRIVACTNDRSPQIGDVEWVALEAFPNFARQLEAEREAELRHLKVRHFSETTPGGPMRQVLLLIDPDTIDTMEGALLPILAKGRKLGVSIHYARLSNTALG